MNQGTSSTKFKSVLPGYLFLLPALVLFVVFQLYPMLMSVLYSFHEFKGAALEFVGVSNYVEMFTNAVYKKSIVNSLLFVIGNVPLVVLFSLFVAGVMHDKNTALLAFSRAAFYLPSISSIVTICLMWTYILNPISGVLNYFIGLLGGDSVNWLGSSRYALPTLIFIIFTINIGQAVVLQISAMQNIPKEYDEAAAIDGANQFVKFIHITLPLIKPTTLFIVIISTIQSFQTFGVVLLLTAGGPNYSTTTIVYQLYQSAFMNTRFGLASTMGVILGVVVVIVSIFQYRLMSSDTEY